MYPEDGSIHHQVIKTWQVDEIGFTIIKHKHHCGYARFPKRPVLEEDYDGILTYVPVHGGITYARDTEGPGMVYGFDCGHSGDDENPQMNDVEWLTAECERMAKGIQVAAEFEPEYLAADNPGKADVIQRYHDRLAAEGIKFSLTDNFGAMISVMFGSL